MARHCFRASHQRELHGMSGGRLERCVHQPSRYAGHCLLRLQIIQIASAQTQHTVTQSKSSSAPGLSHRLFFADYDDDLDVYYVSSSPTKKTKWRDFFQLEQFKTTRVHQLLKEVASKWSYSRITYLPSFVRRVQHSRGS